MTLVKSCDGGKTAVKHKVNVMHTLPSLLLTHSGEYESVMLVSNQDIQALEECIDKCRVCSSSPVRPQSSFSSPCFSSFPPSHSPPFFLPPFTLQVCQLCKPCQNESYSFLLKTAFLEHVNRRNFKRIYPPPPPSSLLLPLPPSSSLSLCYKAWKGWTGQVE